MFAFGGKSDKVRAKMLRFAIFARLNVTSKSLPLPTAHNLSHGDDEFIHILAGVVEGEGGTDTHLVAESSEGGLGAVVTGTYGDALLI